MIFESYVQKQGLEAIEKVAEAAVTSGSAENVMEEDAPSAPKKALKKADNETDPKAFVEAILFIYKKYFDLVSNCFKGESGFLASLDR